ncbi:isopropanol dehydrogenase [Seiridium cupressi]
MATSMASSVPQKHRALVLKSTKDPYDMSVVLQGSPHAGPGSLVARVLAAGVLTYAARVYSGRKPYTYPEPFVPGSSAICRVAETGPDTTLLKPGRLIFFDCFIAGRDDDTALILHGLSDGFTAASVGLMEREWRDSTYAEYAKLPLENCFPLDEARLTGSPTNGGLGYTVNDLLYLFTISVPFGGLRDVDIKAGEKVVIAPATGTFGSAAVVAALAMGARVIAMGRNTDTLEQLKPLSSDGRVRVVQNTGEVDADVKTLTKDGPIDAFFDISPGRAFNSPHYKSCILSLKRGGRVSLMAAHEELTLPTQTIMLNDITVKGKWMYTKKDMVVMINLAEAGFMKLGEAAGVKTVGTFPLEKFEDAFQMAADIRGPCMQVVITP